MTVDQPPLNKKQRELLGYFRKRDGQQISDVDILSVTGWSEKSWKVYRRNGLYAPFLMNLASGGYQVRCGLDVSDWTFYKAVTQNKSGSVFAPRCKTELGRALAARSRDNMILALELYNRPSLKNRLDGFALLFCAAWEQLLKAEIIEKEGEASIYREKKPGRPRETISLRQAMGKCLQPDSLVRKNLDYITDLRDKAAHLLMPEARSSLGYLFQAGILNYASRFVQLTADAFLDDTSGLVSLVGSDEPPPTAVLMRTYGEITGTEINELLLKVRADIESTADQTFAISVEHKLVLTKKPGEADIHLGGVAGTSAVVVEREVATERRYPYRAGTLCPEVVRRSGASFSTYDLNAVCLRESWTKGDNEHHRLLTITGVDTHLYSELALEFILRKLADDEEYLTSARTSLRSARRKKRTRKKR